MTTRTTDDWTAVLGATSFGRVVYSEVEIAHRVEEMGAAITAHYGERGRILVLGLLKGSFIFLADLVRTIRLPLQVDFLVVSSYGSDTVSSGEVELLYGSDTSVAGRHVLLVEDIVDSGTTLERLLPVLEERGPASVEICALLHKRLVTLEKEARWVGFDAPPEFLVGYGLDHAEEFRHLPFIGSIDSARPGGP
jgi:hypoxanthine phosphoribosyltransferase